MRGADRLKGHTGKVSRRSADARRTQITIALSALVLLGSGTVPTPAAEAFANVSTSNGAVADLAGDPSGGVVLAADRATDGAPVEHAFDLDDVEVTWYAERHGITKERSLEIANWMTEARVILEDLHNLEGNYARMVVRHGGDDGAGELPVGDVAVEIMMKDVDDPLFQQMLEDVRKVPVGDEVPLITVVEVPKSLVELEAEAAAEMARHEPGSIKISFDYLRGELIIEPAPEPDPNANWN
jgi:hypothetical protein